MLQALWACGLCSSRSSLPLCQESSHRQCVDKWAAWCQDARGNLQLREAPSGRGSLALGKYVNQEFLNYPVIFWKEHITLTLFPNFLTRKLTQQRVKSSSEGVLLHWRARGLCGSWVARPELRHSCTELTGRFCERTSGQRPGNPSYLKRREFSSIFMSVRTVLPRDILKSF